VITAGGFLLVLWQPAAWSFTLAQAGRRTAEYALTRPAREVLYTVVPRADKYKAKTFIDTFVYRSGDALGAWWFPLLGGATAFSMLTALLLPAAAVWAALSLWLGRQQQQRSGAPPVLGLAAVTPPARAS
jgi:AAA family ATP:ADP antiporter